MSKMDPVYVPIERYKPYQSEEVKTYLLADLCEDYGVDNVLAAMTKRCASFAQANKKICLADQALLKATGGFVDAFEGDLTDEMIANYSIDLVRAAAENPDLAPQLDNVMKKEFGINNVRTHPRTKFFGFICIAFLLSSALLPSKEKTMTTDLIVRPTTDVMVVPSEAFKLALLSAYKNQPHEIFTNQKGQTVLSLSAAPLPPPVLVIAPFAQPIFNEMKRMDADKVVNQYELSNVYNARIKQDQKSGRVYAFAANIWEIMKRDGIRFANDAGKDINIALKQIMRKSYTLIIDAKETSVQLLRESINDDVDDPQYAASQAIFIKKYDVFLDDLTDAAYNMFSEQAANLNQRSSDFNQVAAEAIQGAYIYLQSSILDAIQTGKEIVQNGIPSNPLRISPRTTVINASEVERGQQMTTTVFDDDARPTPRKRTSDEAFETPMPITPAPSQSMPNKTKRFRPTSSTSTSTSPRSITKPRETLTTSASPSSTSTSTSTTPRSITKPRETLTSSARPSSTSPSTSPSSTSPSSTSPSPSSTSPSTSSMSPSPSSTPPSITFVIPNPTFFTDLDDKAAKETPAEKIESKSAWKGLMNAWSNLERILDNL